MEKFESLADLLGVQEPNQPECPPPASPKKLSIKAHCREVLASREYRESLLRRIVMDELPPAVELWYLNTAHGKPVDRLEVKDVTDPVEDFTAEQCEERATRLLEVARHLRADNKTLESSAQESVH